MNLFEVGEKYFIRTVTNYFTGSVVAVVDGFVCLECAAWIPDTGRFFDALSSAELREVEPYVDNVFVSIAAIVDFTKWHHDLPVEQM